MPGRASRLGRPQRTRDGKRKLGTPSGNGESRKKKFVGTGSQNAFGISQNNSDDGDDLSDQNVVKPEDDEEIDSDEAFVSGDEERYGSFQFSGSRKAKQEQRSSQATRPRPKRSPRKVEVDLDEDTDSSDLATKTFKNMDKASGNRPLAASATDTDDQEDDSASDFENDGGDDLIDLSEMLNSSSGQTNAGTSMKDSTNASRALVEQIPYTAEGSDSPRSDETDDKDALSLTSDSESSFSGDHASDLDFNDILALQQDSEQKPIIRQQEQIMPNKKSSRPVVNEINEQATESEYNLNTSSMYSKLKIDDIADALAPHSLKTLRRSQTLNAPLAKPIQDRLNRNAAYDLVKEQITKWQPAVKQLREASVLKFPLVDPAQAQSNTNRLAATFKPTNELEGQIDSILKESGMQSEQQVSRFEDLAMAKLSVEEVQKRRAELAIMRDLMFRRERKAKRQNKIKSKAYRKVHRKEREKLQAALDAEAVDTTELHDKHEEERARERMELRHKNTGKWAKKQIARANHGEESRSEITAQLQRGEDLERKILGRRLSMASNESTDDAQSASDNDHSPLPDKGVFSMKFMRDADERGRMDQVTQDESYDTEEGTVANGRRKFLPTNRDSSTLADRSSRSQRKKHGTDAKVGDRETNVVVSSLLNNSLPAEDDVINNPWLLGPVAKNSTSSGTMAGRDSSEDAKALAKLQKIKRRLGPAHQGNIKSSSLDTNKTLLIKSKETGLPVKELRDTTSDILHNSSTSLAFNQAELVSKAFAGDDVADEFNIMKETITKHDAPQDLDMTLPGWGAWTGEGIKKNSNRKKFTKHVEGIEAGNRKDTHLQHVIINEKRIKSAKTLMSQSVPFPYENREQYERSLNLPLGPEWTTRSNFQKAIIPKVVSKQGVAIAPMKRPFND